MNSLQRLSIHPFLWSLYPLLMLVANNLDDVNPLMVYRSLLVSLLSATLLLIVLWLLLRNWQKAALLVTICLVLFFTYGHFYGSVVNLQVMGVLIGRHKYLFPLWLVILVGSSMWVLRTRRDLRSSTQILNIIAIIALIFPVVQIASFEVSSNLLSTRSRNPEIDNPSISPELINLHVPENRTLPDIYYIILDSYTRDDTLLRYLEYNNASFLNLLIEEGFYISYCSQSNYALTTLSLASTLNLNYLDELMPDLKTGSRPSVLYPLVLHSAVRQVLESFDYLIIAFESGYSVTEWVDADIYLSPKDRSLKSYLLGGINTFEALVLRTSAGLLLYHQVFPPSLRAFTDAAYIEHRDRMLYVLDQLENLPSRPERKFVFAHLLAPHAPFVFGKNGEFVDRETPFMLNDDPDNRDITEYVNAYRDQVTYINGRILRLVRKIITDSSTPPIIIIQGDHGPAIRVTSRNGRMTILNAFYLPGNSTQHLYDAITPVNTFRVVFNEYFGGELGLLEDRSYFSRNGDEFSFVLSPNKREDCREMNLE